VQKGNDMKLLASIRSLLAPADEPLVILGPGGDFTEHLVDRDGRLAIEAPADHSMQELAESLPNPRCRRHRINRFLAADFDRTPSHEPHPQAAAHLRVHPHAPRIEGLLAHDAGDRRLARRHQGDGVRARRGAHQEGRAGARSEQESLFVDC